MRASNALLKDLSEMLREKHEAQKEYWKELFEPVRVTWRDRPWWLRKRYIRSVFAPLIPKGSKSLNKLRQYRGYTRLREEMLAFGEHYPNLFNKLHRRPSSLMMVYLSIEETVAEVEPFKEFLVERGWELKSAEDSYDGKNLWFKNDEAEFRVLLIARPGDGASCEVVEHERKVVKTEKEYEVICAGERELTGRV